jgi:hypothetical protein
MAAIRLGIASKRVPYGSHEYRERAKHMARLAFRAYEGGAIFRWLNRRPYIEEPYDYFLAGKVFGAVLRRAYGGRGQWKDMSLAWVEDLRKACEEDGAVAVELDGEVEFPVEYVERLLRAIKGWI